MVGEKDKSADVEASKKATLYIPNTKFEILPNAPHPFEKNDMVLLSQKVNIFLRDDRQVMKLSKS